ncbi:L,D-transpeptidase family protein [Lysobacter claricitrinus]|uniref:L,D-transpeptidase family protein n=1 Tax=Lysobacter claricitrinus TaxID=3367728 RepID=UPI0037DBE969
MKTSSRIAVRRRVPSTFCALAIALVTFAQAPAFAQDVVATPAQPDATIVEPAAATTTGDAVLTAPSLPAPDAPLAAGKFEWTPNDAATGPITIVVSLPAQMVHVYRGDVRIARSTISSGRPGYDTPAGVYEILEKDRMHHSNKYDNAPMPFMQRLTWDGVALHAGHIPGYPASHGCVRLPMAFAEQLFKITERGGRVIVADATNFSDAVLYPGARVPVDPWTGAEINAGGGTVASTGAIEAPAPTPTTATSADTAPAMTTPVAATAVSALAGN